ncbi:MAG: dockerin type I repeat-containing protein, partial [Nanoarchaeota archaeon]|nr:dockerin type I repeat-containing protein [Nanoarchaeota archaeon]
LMKRGFIFAFILVILLSSSVFALEIVEGKKKVIGVYAYLDFREDPDNLVPFVKEDAVNILYGETGSVRSYFKEMSFGKVDIVGFDGNPGDLDDIFILPIPLTQEECTSLKFLEKVVEELKKRGVVEHELIIAMLSVEGKCILPDGGGGFSIAKDYGTAENPLLIRFAVDLASVGFGKFELSPLSHEVSHSLGIGHAMFKKCLFAEGVSPDDCKDVIEHGDPFDLMGGSNKLTFSNARLLESVGWLSTEGEHILKEINKESFAQSKTYTLKPLADPNPGLKALKIPHGFYYDSRINVPYTTHLYVEWRKQIGLDNELSILSDSNVFDGVLLHISDGPGTGFLYSSIFFPIPIDTTLECNPGFCPRAKKAVLPYGETYTDPNSGTKIKVGFPNADGLPITIEELGRTDFEAPVIGDMHVVERPDSCTEVLEVKPTDESGIGKVIFYNWDLNSNRETSKKVIVELTESPYKFEYNIIDYSYQGIFVRVYDKFGNYADELNIVEDVPRTEKCLSSYPEIIIESPYLDRPYSTEGEVLNFIDDFGDGKAKYLDFRFPTVKGPIPITIKVKSEDPLHIIQAIKNKNRDLLFNNVGYPIVGGRDIIGYISQYYDDKKIKEYEADLNLILGPGENHLFVKVQNQQNYASYLSIRFRVLPSTSFIRGDANNNGNVELGDAVKILDYLYSGGQELQCDDSGDANDNGVVDISDAIIILNYLFNGNPASLPKPNNLEGGDETYDKLSCGHSVCRDKMCVVEFGEGKDECALDVDCGLTDEEFSEEYPNGDNPFVKGNLPYEDRCVYESFLSEFDYKAPDYGHSIDCRQFGNYICKGGRCVENLDFCSDSDANEQYPDGNNKYVKGEVIYGDQQGQFKSVDKCNKGIIEGDCSGTGCYLSERYCVNEEWKIKTFSCTCVDGACVQA